MKQLALGLLGFGAVATSAAAQLLPIHLSPPAAATTEPTEISRKMEALEVAGLTVPASGLQESVILSARQPWRDSRTFVDFTQAIGYSTRGNFVTVAGVPTVAMAFSVPPGAELMWKADPSKRHIIDCEVSGAATQIRFRWGDPPPDGMAHLAGTMSSTPSSGVQGEALATVAKGRVSTVLPAGIPGSVRLSADTNWQFRSCEITPVTI